MGKSSRLRRFTVGLWLVSAGLLLSGTKACQEDYDLGSRTSVRNTPTPTPTEDEGDEPTATPTATPTQTPTPAGSVPPTLTPSAGIAFLGALSAMARSFNGDADEDTSPGVRGDGASNKTGVGGNWLGRSYLKGDRPQLDDSDNDGYSDELERASGTDPQDEYSQPRPGASVLSNRFRGLDDDYDGLSNGEEAALGTDPSRADSDGDGARDGAEFASESDPLDSGVLPIDRDRDGLSDQYEIEIGTDPSSADSDKDKLSDSVEIAIDTNPLAPDSDGDGVFDGREYQSGSDPLVKDF